MHLFKEGQVAATLSEAQQQRQDVDGAGGLLRLLGARRSRSSLGQTKLLSHCRREKHMHSSDQATHSDDKDELSLSPESNFTSKPPHTQRSGSGQDSHSTLFKEYLKTNHCHYFQ